MLVLKNIDYFIGKKPILKNINLDIESQSIFALLGANGAGKTSLIKLIMGIISPTNGEIFFEDKNYQKIDRIERLRKMGSLIEQASLYKHLSAFENLEQARRVYATDKSETIRILEIVGLDSVMKQKVSTFSLGMKQRLGLALAMIGKPKFIILDEPTNGIDPQGVLDFRNLVLRLNQKEKITFLISSHILQDIEKTASHIAIIDEGTIVLQEKMSDLANKNLEDLYLNRRKATF
jgi:ABC-2 type transport system ATP-binding protein